MTDDQHGEGTSQGGGRWDPLPQGDYDDGATAFVKLPEGGIEALLAADSPLAAPGHGYVPPQITVAPASDAGTDPAGTGSWAMPAGGGQWPDPNAVPQEAGPGDQFTYHPAATQHWAYEEPAQHPAHPAQAAHGHDMTGQEMPGQDVTGQWSIPVAEGDLPDESGEFTTSSLVEQWGNTAPATLPGGAAAPWATETVGEPWGPQPPADANAGAGHAVADDFGHQHLGAPGHLDHPDHAPVPEAYAGTPDDHATDELAEPAEFAEAAEASADADGGAEAPGGAPEPLAEPEAADDAGTGPEGAEAAATGDDESGALPEPESAEATETAEPAESTESAPLHDDHPLASYVLSVNGADRPVTDAWIGESLLYVLRERLGLAGAKDGCSQGECGACNVQVDGRLVASCLVPAVTAAGSEVRTVEGLAVEGRPSDVQRALAKCGAVQCGFCVPGMAMTLHDLLEGNPAPTELEARQALCGNLCRCSGYRGVLDAVQEVVAEREAQAAAEAEAEAATDADEARIPHQAGPGAGGVHPSAFDPAGSLQTPVAHDQSYNEQPYQEPYREAYDQPYDQPYGQDGGQA